MLTQEDTVIYAHAFVKFCVRQSCKLRENERAPSLHRAHFTIVARTDARLEMTGQRVSNARVVRVSRTSGSAKRMIAHRKIHEGNKVSRCEAIMRLE